MNEKRKKVVNDLIENRGFKEDMRGFLMGISKEAIYAIVKNASGNEETDLEVSDMGFPAKPLLSKKDVANASDEEEEDKKKKDEEDTSNKKSKNKSSKNSDDEEEDEEENKSKNKKKACNTVEEWLEVAPNHEIKEFLVKAINDAKEEKDKIVKSLLENKDNKFTKEELEAKSKIELDKLNALVSNASTTFKKNLPAGSKTVATNSETTLSIPTLEDVCGVKK